MDNDNSAVELHRKYRPKRIKDIVGQDEAVEIITNQLERGFPHATILAGPSGCGKTTVARILRGRLGCAGGDRDRDYHEINAAKSRGIDMVRDLSLTFTQAPWNGKAKIYLLDEAHALSSDAQDALLKMTEDVPDYVYFFLCTTLPEKLKLTLRTRCLIIPIKPIDVEVLAELVKTVADKEGVPLAAKAQDHVAEAADGSARMALQILQKLIGVDQDKQLSIILKANTKRQAFDLVKALVWEPKLTWEKVASIIRGLPDGEDWERLRRLVLSCATTEALKANKNTARVYEVLEEFNSNWFDSGRAGLIRACLACCRAANKQ